MNKIISKFIFLFSFVSLIFLALLYILFLENPEFILNLSIIYVIFIGGVVLLFLYRLRSCLVKNNNDICKFLDQVISKRQDAEFNVQEESLFSKEQSKIKELVNILDSEKKLNEDEKIRIQSLVSDLSHQIKTPLANLSMYNSTLMERKLDNETEKEFLGAMKGQIEKLNWLIEALVKISRLETEIISLKKYKYRIEDTLSMAIGSVYSSSIEKNIMINIENLENLEINHDKKWTAEALFNIIENAVKYSPRDSKINISVKSLEIFIRIDIQDEGIGIRESDINNIFKRFYRSQDTAEYKGVGIGLYLAREIISKQGGYIKVYSTLDRGSTFSVFLPKTF